MADHISRTCEAVALCRLLRDVPTSDTVRRAIVERQLNHALHRLTDEEAWQTIQSLTQTAQGAGNLTYNQVYVGQKEDTYKPAMYGLMGPLLNQDDLTMYWNSA